MTNQLKDTPTRLVGAATDLFWNQGFTATSIAQILRRAQVNSGSLYHFFRGKNDLLVAAIAAYPDRYWRDMMDPTFDREPDPLERIGALFALHRAELAAYGFTRGSFLGNLALEVADASPLAQAAIADAFTKVHGWLKLWLIEAADRLPEDTDFDALASFLLASLEGAVMQVRARKSLVPFDAVTKYVRDALRRLTIAGVPAAELRA